MKILIISAAYPPMHAGESANTYHLAVHLRERGCDVHVLTAQGNVGTGEAGITVHPVMRGWSWLDAARLWRFVRRCSPDAVLVMYLGKMYGFHPMITFVPTLVKRTLPQVPVVTRFENVFVGVDPTKSSWASRAFRKAVVQWASPSDVGYSEGTLLRDSDWVVTLCERHYDGLLEGFSHLKSKILIIPPPPNMVMCSDTPDSARARGREKLGLTSDHFVITFLGYLYPHKGVETLIRAFQVVSRTCRNARLVFVGGQNDLDVAVDSAYFAQMKKLTNELGLDEHVIWTGAYSPETEEASVYLYASDVCVFPILAGVHFNNSSFSSALAHGLPVIAARGSSLESPLKERENVMLFPPNDFQALAAAIEELIRDPLLRERLRGGALSLTKEWFSWDEALARTMRLFIR